MCDKDLVRTEDTRAIAPVSEKTISDYLQAFGLAGQLSKQEVSQFVEVAKAFQLNPFKREIYCVPYGEGDKRKLSIITGYETYLKRADLNPAYNGYETTIKGRFIPGKVTRKGKNGGTYQADALVPDGDVFCECKVYRKDRDVPTKVEIDFNEYNQHNSMWESKPRTMIEKVAIAQAFRKAFPNDMGGMPYTSEELPDEMNEPRDVTPMPQPQAEPSPAPAPQMEAPTPAPQTEPVVKAKATAEQTRKLAELAKNFTQEELAALKKDYGHDIEMLIDKMVEYSNPEPTPQAEPPRPHRWASPQVAEALAKAGGNAQQFADDSQELYK